MTTPLSARILVVDDEALLMDALRKTLGEEGYEVEGVVSGKDALDALKHGNFDLILTDLMMPRMDGISLLKSALKGDPNITSIVMTGHGSVPTAVEAMKIGATDYVLKPIKLNTLLTAIERALTIRRLRVKNEELEKRIRERTVELEAANKELGAFSDSISHDLRTPLRAINGFAEIIIGHHSAELSPDVERYMGLILKGAEQMAQLIHDLLAFSKLGHQPLTRKLTDVHALCRDVIKDSKAEYAGRKVDFHVGELPMAYCDPALLRQVMINLISNSVKYTRGKDPAIIEVGTMPGEDDKTGIYFVRDNGVGFDMHDAGKLFGVFQRLHSSREFEGTGVGLAIVRRIVERHGGRVWTEAAPNAGATFFFTLGSVEPK